MDNQERIIHGLKEFARKTSETVVIQKMIFFGSMATGSGGKDSDIGLIIVSPQFRNISFWKRAIGLHNNWTLDYPVDFLCLSPEEFEKKSGEVTIISEALKAGGVHPQIDTTS